MLPLILAVVGGYFIGDSMKDKAVFADGGNIDDLSNKEVEELYDEIIANIYPDIDIDEMPIMAIEEKREFLKENENYYSEGGMMAKGGKIGSYQLVPYKNIDGDLVEKMYKQSVIFDGSQEEALAKARNMISGDISSVEVSIINPKATNFFKRTKKIEVVYAEGGMMAKGGMVVTSIKDIPNFKKRLDEGKITYRGLGGGKLSSDFYKLTGESGVRIKVDKKEYYITDKEFDTFSRGADGRMRISFDAPHRRFADGGEIARSNQEMVSSQVKAIKHHADELSNLVTDKTPVEAWVVSKVERSETDLSDVTHYLDGLKYSDGGVMARGGKTINKNYAIIHFSDKKSIKKRYDTAYGAFSDYENQGAIYAELFNETGHLLSEYPKKKAI